MSEAAAEADPTAMTHFVASLAVTLVFYLGAAVAKDGSIVARSLKYLGLR